MTTKIIKNISHLSTCGLKFFLFASVLLLSSCYYYPNEQVVTQPAQNQQNITAVTQIYFYPTKGQSTQQQSRDHYACYNWAVEQTGFDPSVSSIVPDSVSGLSLCRRRDTIPSSCPLPELFWAR